MRKVTMLCGLLLLLGASGLAAQRAGHRHRDSTAVNASSGLPTGQRLHNAGSTTVSKLNIDPLPSDSPGGHRGGKRGRKAGGTQLQTTPNNSAVSPGVASPSRGQFNPFSTPPVNAGTATPDYTRYKKAHRGAGVGRAGAGKANLNNLTVGGNQNPAGMVSPRVKANPAILDSGPTARRMPRPHHRQRPDSLQVP